MLRISLTVLTILAAVSLPCDPVRAQVEKPAKLARESRTVAVLGMTTNAPTMKEARDRGLKFEVRCRGQLVTSVAKGGPAAKAGIKVDDVLVQFDENELFSEDDIADFLLVSKPGQIVVVHVQRAKTDKKVKVKLELGSEKIDARTEPVLEWQFAGLGQLDDALAKAKKEGRLVLVGLSGAET